MEPDDPPPKTYGFKEREFKRDNTPSSPPPPTAKEHALASGHVDSAPRKVPPSGGANRAADPNDVYAVLEKNRAIEQKFGLNEVQIKEIKSKRQRDYWLMMLTINPALITIAVLGRHNFIILVSALAGVIVVSIGLTWIMWQVMSKY